MDNLIRFKAENTILAESYDGINFTIIENKDNDYLRIGEVEANSYDMLKQKIKRLIKSEVYDYN